MNTYLKEEILQEQLVRDAVPFRKFLPIAAQMSGKILNLNAIAHDLGVDWTTVKNYFEILEDTWLGIMLPSYHPSLRKQQLKAPKFYLFDIGVQRTLDRTIKIEEASSQMLGPLFEPSVFVEIKSSSEVKSTQLRHLSEMQKESPEFEAICISREKQTRKIGNVLIMPWMEAFGELGIPSS